MVGTLTLPLPRGPWIWADMGGDFMLVTRHGGAKVVLCSGPRGIQTRDPETGILRDVRPDEPLARAIEALPELWELIESMENDAGQVPDWFWKKVLAVRQRVRGEAAHTEET